MDVHLYSAHTRSGIFAIGCQQNQLENRSTRDSVVLHGDSNATEIRCMCIQTANEIRISTYCYSESDGYAT